MNKINTHLKNNGNIKRKFLFVSRWGESLDIAYTTLLEGNNVKMFIEDKPSKEIGIIKEAIKEAILEGEIPNEHDAAFNLMIKKGEALGLIKS